VSRARTDPGPPSSGPRAVVLLTAVAHEAFGAGLERPGVDWLTMEGDGTLRDGGGRTVEPDDARADVAWGTSDLFRQGAPIGAFFGLLTRIDGLAWFQSPAAGFDDSVFSELVARGVRVSNAHVNSLPIAEFVMRSVLDELQDAQQWRSLAGQREWKIHDWRELSGTTWLIVGLGGIGSAVAVRARAFGARVIGCRRHPAADDPTDRTVTPDQLPEVVGQADVIVLAAPSTPDTTDLFDAPLLARVQPGAIFVNVARGTLVDEDALLEALDRGRPGVAVLDVFRQEPLPEDHPFWTHPSVRVTPHNAAGGSGRFLRQAELFADNLDRYLAGRRLIHDVTAEIAGRVS
jgi:phosphoglycerate dehydrogenase-like enzyme